jgi:hypothetical protein
MTLFYRVPNPEITSISVDGIEHVVNRETGLLEVEVMTPGLEADLRSREFTQVPKTEMADEVERQGLFTELETATGKKIDRRRSLQQLRQQRQDLADAGKLTTKA